MEGVTEYVRQATSEIACRMKAGDEIRDPMVVCEEMGNCNYDIRGLNIRASC